VATLAIPTVHPHTVTCQAAGSLGGVSCAPYAGAAVCRSAWAVRPLLPKDATWLMRRAGPTVAGLYPRGAELLESTLLDALNRYASAHVVVGNSQWPAALICEKPKGDKRVKVSTFWVDPAARGSGVGRLLAHSRFAEWRRLELEEVYGTSRQYRTPAVSRVFRPLGFSTVHTAEDRYGEGRHEDVLQWRADHVAPDNLGMHQCDTTLVLEGLQRRSLWDFSPSWVGPAGNRSTSKS